MKNFIRKNDLIPLALGGLLACATAACKQVHVNSCRPSIVCIMTGCPVRFGAEQPRMK